jgi:two-component system, LytTR family, sensor histidine kinase NatK
MINKGLYSLLLIGHFVFAFIEWLPIWVSILLGAVIAFKTSKYITFDLHIFLLQAFLLPLYFLVEHQMAPLFIFSLSIFILVYSSRLLRKIHTLRMKNTSIDSQQLQFNETFQLIRKERHDYLKHIAAIQYLLEKNEYDQTKSYINSIVNQFEETNLSIKGEHGAIASVLHTNFKRAREKNIAINYQLEVPISSMPISSAQLVELLGNLLENAIDACEKWQTSMSTQGIVELSLRKRSGLFLLICENSTPPLPIKVADELFMRSGVTTKDGHDGLGTTIIQTIVQKHHGYLEFITEKNKFKLICKVPDVLH